MKIAISNGDIVRDDDALSDLDALSTHENSTSENCVISYFQTAARLNIKFRPSKGFNPVT